MYANASKIAASLIALASMLALPAQAGPLGNLLGGDGDGLSTGNIVDVQSGSAGSDALVNVGLGGGNGNVADIKLGGTYGESDPLAYANVSSNGLLDDTSLTAGLNLGNTDLGVDGSLGFDGGIDAGLGLDLGLGFDSGGNGGAGGGGQLPGGGSGGGVLPGTGGNATLLASLDANGGVGCSIEEGRQILQIAAKSEVTRQSVAAWRNVANVRILPMPICPAAHAKVASLLNASGKIVALRGAASADALISASLNRSRYDAGDIFAVQKAGGQLVVYVF